ncbi:N,N-dimethylformamidase beta subunit family domain-containing protein [Longispora albida]|uniref:N,N-dimethylformamidase beta subunit family domain-containing protein n=1 Tax=Longispora albida TaxID=203523 RepID=UPI00036E443F|nr:N,N-dimethylformamidase beta subunit family domain-containing protein [Longispora albida]
MTRQDGPRPGAGSVPCGRRAFLGGALAAGIVTAAPRGWLDPASAAPAVKYDAEQYWIRMFGGGNGIIYTVRADGVLFWWRHAGWFSGAFDWLNCGGGRAIGTGWQNTMWIGAAADGSIFALRGNGELWRYQYVTTDLNEGFGFWADGGTLLATGWDQFDRVFGGPDGILYAIDHDGILFRTQFTGGALPPLQPIGNGWNFSGWVAADSGGVIYAEMLVGLAWFRYSGGAWANNAQKIIIDERPGGVGYSLPTPNIELFTGMGGTFYGIQPDFQHVPQYDNTLKWFRLANPLTVASDGGPNWAGYDVTVGTGWTVQRFSALQGYATPLSVGKGQVARFAVSTTFDSFTATVLRFGDSSGEVPAVWGPQTFPGQFQFLQPGYRIEGCGWTENLSVPVPVTWRSGVYAVEVTGKHGISQLLPFIVKPGSPQGQFMVLLPTNTYHAYNEWGGHGQYSADLLKQRVLSMNRPMPLGFFNADLYLLMWMDREGLTFDVYADADLDANPSLPQSYTGLVLGSHPEYYSPAMRQALITYQDSGGKIIYCGGNGIFERVSYSADRSQVIFRRADGARDLWDDYGLPASQIVGTNYNACSDYTWGPYKVTQQHPLLTGTGLNVGDTFGAFGYNGPASGLETDNLLGGDGEAFPEEIFAVGAHGCASGGAVMCLVQKGNGWAFSASSMSFTGALLTDTKMSTILRNVFDLALNESTALPPSPALVPARPAKPVQPPAAREENARLWLVRKHIRARRR